MLSTSRHTSSRRRNPVKATANGVAERIAHALGG
jgi:hypothetical protein